MTGPVSVASWSESSARPEDPAFWRLWRAFGTARVAVAAAVLGLLAAQTWVAPPVAGQETMLGVGAAYLAAAVIIRALFAPPGTRLNARWILTVGIDLTVVATLQAQHAGGLTFSPLYAIPVLMASVLGGRLIAYGTAGAVTLMLMAEVGLDTLTGGGVDTPRLLQAALTGSGFFALTFLTHQLAGRLAREEQRALASQEAARLQAQVNGLVIETLSDGILVVDGDARVRAANPTACELLGPGSALGGFSLEAEPAWEELLSLTRQTLFLQSNQIAEVAVDGPDRQRRLFARTRLAVIPAAEAGRLCVVFLEDLREMEARLRTQKLAAMGRMSAAVAHEIRNPLTAITQANALLDEDLSDPVQRQLSAMVRQNALRLAQIVEEILDVARVQQQPDESSPLQALDASVGATCAEWSRQSEARDRLRLVLGASQAQVPFEAEHLRRVLVNLLDNAARHAAPHDNAIQVATQADDGRCRLVVWSDGAPLEAAVERHLFEPFFSSHSRSSGLGLYICRELCERHGAEIGYRRMPSPVGGLGRGNAFFVNFRPPVEPQRDAAPATIAG